MINYHCLISLSIIKKLETGTFQFRVHFFSLLKIHCNCHLPMLVTVSYAVMQRAEHADCRIVYLQIFNITIIRTYQIDTNVSPRYLYYHQHGEKHFCIDQLWQNLSCIYISCHRLLSEELYIATCTLTKCQACHETGGSDNTISHIDFYPHRF